MTAAMVRQAWRALDLLSPGISPDAGIGAYHSGAKSSGGHDMPSMSMKR
jgi:hypothetical protein